MPTYATICSGIEAMPAADSPRYKAIGNSWPVPVARWLLRRLDRALSPQATP